MKKAREEVFELMRKKKQLVDAIEREEGEEKAASRELPPVPLFAAAVREEDRAVGTVEDEEGSELKRRVEELSRQLAEQTAVREKLQEELGEAQQRVATLLRTTVPTSSHQTTLTAMASLQARLTESEQQRAKQEGEAEQLTQQLTGTAAELAINKGKVSELAAQSTELHAEVATLRAELSHLQQSTVPQADHTAALDAVRAQQQQAEKELTTRLSSIEQRLQSEEAELQNAQALLASERQRSAELSAKVAELSSALTLSAADSTAAASNIASLRSQLSSQEERAAQRDEELKVSQSSLTSERSRAAELSAKVAELTSSLSQSTAESAAAASSVASIQAQLSFLHSVEADLASLTERTTLDIANLRASIVTETERASQLSSSNADLTTQLAQRQRELEELREEHAALLTVKEQLEGKVVAKEGELDAKESQRAAMEEQLYGVILQVHAKEAERRAVDGEHQQEVARWEEKLLAVQLSADAAVQAAEDEAERNTAAIVQVQRQLEVATASLHTAEEKTTETARLLQMAESQRDTARRNLKGVEESCAGLLEDVRLKGQEVQEARERLQVKEAEVAGLHQLFVQLDRKEAERGREDEDEERQEEEKHRQLNDSLVLLESAVQQSVMRRGNSLDQSAAASTLRDNIPVKHPRRFVFVNNNDPPQPTTPRQQRSAAAKSPRSQDSAPSRSPAVLSPTSAASASATRAGEAAAQLLSLQSTVAQLHAELKEKQELLAEEGRKVEAHQATIERLRQQAKGTRDGGLTALHRLQASQTRMEELNVKLTAKMQAIHHRKASLQLEAKERQQLQVELGDAHSRTVSAPTLPLGDSTTLSGEVSTLLSQLAVEHALVLEQASQLSALRQQQQVEATFQATLLQRLEQSEEKRLRLRRQVRRREAQWEVEKGKIEQLIEMSTRELDELEEQREERETAIAQLEVDVKRWKDKAEELTNKIDDWAQQEHEETSHKETKKESAHQHSTSHAAADLPSLPSPHFSLTLAPLCLCCVGI